MLHTLGLTLIIILVIVLMVTVAASFGDIRLKRKSDQEALEVLSSANLDQKEIIRQSDLEGLPSCVQKWLKRSNVIGKEKIHTVRFTQTGQMRSEPDKPWMPIEAVQYVNVDKPGFVWKAKMKAAPLINMVGRDRYFQGHGSMKFKLLALLTLVDTKPCMEMDQGTMLRYMAEMIWYPTAALNDYFNWEEIDANSARGTMTWQGVRASMVFHFNDEGDSTHNVAPRYRAVKGGYVMDDWGGVSREYREFHGIRVANKADVIWKYKTGDFNWLKIEVTDIDFNQPGLY